MSATKRILLFNVNWVGDVLFSTAVIRNLRYNYPDSHIACVIPPRCNAVLQGNPYLDEIIIFDEKGGHKGLAGKVGFCLALRRKRFDTVFLLHRSLSRALIVFLAGIPERIGFLNKKRAFLLTQNFPASDIFSTHRADYYLDLLRRSGLQVRDRYTDFPVGAENRAKAQSLLKGFRRDGDFLVAVNPGGNWLPKRWPRENFILLVKRLVEDCGARVIITGGPEDSDLAGEIGESSGKHVLSTCGKSGLKDFAALVGLVDVFITADSGPLHIAAASGARKIIALFGPTDPRLTGPVQQQNTVILQKKIDCRIPCYVVDCADNRCMKAISVEDVMEQVKVMRDNHQ